MNTKSLGLLTLAAALALAGCGGGGGSVPTQSGAPVTGGAPQQTYTGPTYPTSFTIKIPKTTSSKARQPKYVTAAVASVEVLLSTVNGSGAPTGLSNNPAITEITSGACASGCTVSGPSVPPGSDQFTITTYDGANATGSMISTLTQAFTVTAGTANSIAATLLGIPATLVWGTAPTGAAGTAFTNTALSFSVDDADGNPITGTYSGGPITLADSDGSGATSLSSTSIASSTDAGALTLSYTGLDIVPATMSATTGVSGVSQANLTFSPTTAPVVPSPTEVDLYATSGTGSSGTVTASQVGWTNGSYGQTIAAALATDGSCSDFGVSPASGTSFTVSVTAASPTATDTCQLTLTGGAGVTAGVLVTYTTTGIGVNAHARH